MSARILNRYVLREGAQAWAGVILVLMSIMLATRFVRFLADAAAGEIPGSLLFKVVGLSSLQYLLILVPVSLLIGIMLALGRLYREQEITAMTACGAGLSALYRPFSILALALAGFTALLAFQVGPWSGRAADALFKQASRVVQYSVFSEGQFREIAGGRGVVYAQSVDDSGIEVSDVFMKIEDEDYRSVIVAKSASQSVDGLGNRKLVLGDGQRIAGQPGSNKFELTEFGSFVTRISPPEFIYVPGKRKLASTSDLIASGTPEDIAELHWRLSVPLSVFILTLMAVPLSHLQPRQGRYSKVVYGLIVYVLYVNLLGLGQNWIATEKVPSIVGLWWVHGIFLSVALYLLAKRAGWLNRS